MSLHCILSCLNYRRQYNERDAPCDRLPHLSESYLAGAGAKALSCLCEWAPTERPDTFVCASHSAWCLCPLCPVWPFRCKGRCTRHHVQHAVTSISGHYWSVSWSKSPRSALLSGALRSSLSVLPLQLLACWCLYEPVHCTCHPAFLISSTHHVLNCVCVMFVCARTYACMTNP